MKQEQNFTQGPILPALIRFALPVLLALLLQVMYGAVDMQVVGRFGTAADISAVATGSQIMQTATMIITSLAMGLTVLLGQKIGEGKREEAGRVVGGGIFLFLIVAVVMTAALLLAAPAVATLLKAPESAFDGTVAYVRICGAGTLFIMAFNLLGSIFRGLGDSKLPLISVCIACVVNIIGDLVLVAVCGMGVVGAAIATVLAQAVSVVLSLQLIRRRQLPFAMTRKDVRFHKAHIRNILFLGTPIALQEMLVSVSFLVITAIANGMGVVASAGVGVAGRLCAFIMLVPSAYMQSMSAFVAQNIGAGQEKRARKALWSGILSSLVVGAFMFWLGFFHGDFLSAIFAEDGAVVLAAAEYLKSYAIDCFFTSFLFCFLGYFNGCGQSFFVMLQGMIGAFGVRVPVAILMSKIAAGSLFWLGMATPASSVVQILLCLAALQRRKRKMLAQETL